MTSSVTSSRWVWPNMKIRTGWAGLRWSRPIMILSYCCYTTLGYGLEWAEDRVWTGPGSPEEGKIFVAPPAMRPFVNIFLTTCGCSCSSSFTVKVCVCVSGHCSTLWNRKSKAPSASHYPQWTVHDGANVVRPAHSAAGVRFSVSVTVATRRWRHATIILVAIIGLRRERKCADTIGTVSVTRAGHFQC